MTENSATVVKAEKTYTLSVRFMSEAFNDLEALKKQIQATSRIKVMYYALWLLYRVVNAFMHGNNIYVGTEERGVREMHIPWLQHLKKQDRSL